MDTVIGIIERKKQGLDCSEAESAELKGYIKEYLSNPNFGSTEVAEDIETLFPLEYGEAWEERK